MKIPTRGREGGLKFNLTPMIDVVFNLIIFFLASSHLAQSENAEAVRLPYAGTGSLEEPEEATRVTVTITADRMLHVGTLTMGVTDLEAMLRRKQGEVVAGAPLEVRIRTDHAVPYQHIEPLLKMCAKLGITKVRFAMLPSSGG